MSDYWVSITRPDGEPSAWYWDADRERWELAAGPITLGHPMGCPPDDVVLLTHDEDTVGRLYDEDPAPLFDEDREELEEI